jgi:predicted small lipoprotein YifL
MTTRLRLIALSLALPLAVTACGKKGKLEPPEGADLYNQTYPAPETVVPREQDESDT